MPAGFTYASETGIDTFVGLFTSEDGSLVIEHDIGKLAAEHGGMGNLETLVEGSRVRFGSVAHDHERGGKEYFFKVSFPDASCANFYLDSTNEKDAAFIQFIARSFRQRGWVPSFLRPLLPEVLRSDCRYRVRLPGGLQHRQVPIETTGNQPRSPGQAEYLNPFLRGYRGQCPDTLYDNDPGGPE